MGITLFIGSAAVKWGKGLDHDTAGSGPMEYPGSTVPHGRIKISPREAQSMVLVRLAMREDTAGKRFPVLFSRCECVSDGSTTQVRRLSRPRGLGRRCMLRVEQTRFGDLQKEPFGGDCRVASRRQTSEQPPVCASEGREGGPFGMIVLSGRNRFGTHEM